MSGYALFIQHKTKPGKRGDVQEVWQKHMQPTVTANRDHLAYFYCFGNDPDSICAFQIYSNQEAAAAFLTVPAYVSYNEEVKPLLEGEPVITSLHVEWSKEDG
jgi:quinol monooxygenase YgiN